MCFAFKIEGSNMRLNYQQASSNILYLLELSDCFFFIFFMFSAVTSGKKFSFIKMYGIFETEDNDSLRSLHFDHIIFKFAQFTHSNFYESVSDWSNLQNDSKKKKKKEIVNNNFLVNKCILSHNGRTANITPNWKSV